MVDEYKRNPSLVSFMVMAVFAVLVSYGIFHSFKPSGNPTLYGVKDEFGQNIDPGSLNYPPEYRPEYGVGGAPPNIQANAENITPAPNIPWCPK